MALLHALSWQGQLGTALLASVGAWVLLHALRFLRHYAALSSIPSPPRLGFLQGHAIGPTFRGRHRQLQLLKWSEQLGTIYVMRFVIRFFVVVSDPELISQLIRRTPGASKAVELYQPFDKVYSVAGHPSIFTAATSSPQWKAVRKGTTAAFNPRCLRAMHPTIRALLGATTDHILEAARKCEAVNVTDLYTRYSVDAIGLLGFEYDFQAIRHYGRNSHDAVGEMVASMEIMHAEISQTHSNPFRYLKFWNPELAEVRRAMRFFHEQVRQVLRHMRARGPPTEADSSIGAHLQRVIDPRTGKPLTDEYILPEMTVFLVAGSDTTSHTMSFASWLIAAHPHVEARICEELASLGLLASTARPVPRAVEWEDLGKLKYLNAVVKETMRLLPVGAEVGAMQCDRDVVLAGHRIPARTTIWAPIFLYQRSALLWERPNEFDPSRWMQPGTEYARELEDELGEGVRTEADHSAQAQEDEGREERYKPLRYAPFGQGPRSCVGQPMAELSYKSALATIYGRFTYDIDESMPSDPSEIADSGIIALSLHVKKCLLRPRLRVTEK